MNTTAPKTCQRCGAVFTCCAENIDTCFCTNYLLSAAKLEKLSNRYSDCMCENCLAEIVKETAANPIIL